MSDDNQAGLFRQQLAQGLVAAFPDRAKLAQMLDVHLNVQLNAITSEKLGLEDVSYQLITYFEERGRLGDLVDAAISAQPDNATLQKARRELPPPSALARVRGTADRNPRGALVVVFAVALVLVVLVITAAKGRLTEGQLTYAKGAIGVLAAVFIAVLPKRWRLRLGDASVYGAAVAAMLLAFLTPADAGLRGVSGYVFYQGARDPVAGATVVVRDTNQRSERTGADGHFSIDRVPATAGSGYVEYGGQNYPVTFDTASGGEYQIVPRPSAAQPVSEASLDASAWQVTTIDKCPSPSVAFAYEAPIPFHTRTARTYVEISARNNVRFGRTFTLNQTGAGITLPPDQQPHRRRWVFSASETAVRPALRICLEGPAGHTPVAGDIAAKYWYTDNR